MDDQILAEMMGAWTMLSNLVASGLLASAALIATMGSRRSVRASIRVCRRYTN